MFALGFVSVFDQIVEGFEEQYKQRLFESYISALGEDAAKYRVSTVVVASAAVADALLSVACTWHLLLSCRADPNQSFPP